jgi:hypothetical protein
MPLGNTNRLIISIYSETGVVSIHYNTQMYEVIDIKGQTLEWGKGAVTHSKNMIIFTVPWLVTLGAASRDQ